MKKFTMTFGMLATAFLIACGGGSEDASTSMDETTAEESMEEVSSSVSEINTENSNIEWAGTMVGVYTHTGNIDITAGSIEITGDKITGGSITADLNTITPTDENYDAAKENTPEKLVGHLQSPDFFDVATYPTATFEITGSEADKIMGNFTLRGITHQETVENVSHDASTNTWTGTLVFDRKKYDVAWDSPMKEMVLSNDVTLNISLSL